MKMYKYMLALLASSLMAPAFACLHHCGRRHAPLQRARIVRVATIVVAQKAYNHRAH